ncbi:MAG TPA: pilus assembly protein CpaE [Sphingomicrobium sp.]|nr:pilus assembly protein CpaE [Sphingomicrobium sp.]
MSPPDSGKRWVHQGPLPTVRLFLGDGAIAAVALAGAKVGGFEIGLDPIASDAAIDPARLSGAEVAVIEVVPSQPQSVARFETLAKLTRTPLIAAAYDPQLALVRSLVRAGAHDVIPLPLDPADLETSLAPLRERIANSRAASPAKRGKVVSVIKSVGGVGATMLATQLAVRVAGRRSAIGRDVALLDLDLQFGDAAFQLGLHPALSLSDLLDAGNRLDGDLLRATTTAHSSGLKVFAAPSHMLPLEAMTSEQVIDIIDHATREYEIMFVDLPSNWSNWSLSLIARSDLVLLVTEINLSSLNRARRQLEMLASQDLGELDVRVVANRHERGLFKTIRTGDVRDALGRDIAFTVANDHALVRAAIDRGVPVEEIKRKTALAKDLDALGEGIMTSLGITP